MPALASCSRGLRADGDAYGALLAQRLARPRPKGFAASLRHGGLGDWPALAADGDTLLLYGAEDARVAADVAAFAGGAPAEAVPGAGHALLDEAPDAVAAAAVAFLGAGDGATGAPHISEATIRRFAAPVGRPKAAAWDGDELDVAESSVSGAWIALRVDGHAGIGEAA